MRLRRTWQSLLLEFQMLNRARKRNQRPDATNLAHAGAERSIKSVVSYRNINIQTRQPDIIFHTRPSTFIRDNGLTY